MVHEDAVFTGSYSKSVFTSKNPIIPVVDAETAFAFNEFLSKGALSYYFYDLSEMLRRFAWIGSE
jgi:hypothetical protein